MTERVKVVSLRNEQTGQEDRYALSLNMLGEGKFAKVYKATHMKDPNIVYAVKVIEGISAEAQLEYERELKIIKNLPECPNLVKIHKQHLKSENNLYIFQEFCESGTLSHYRNQKLLKPFTEDEVYQMFLQTSKGLIALLEAGIVHEDIKPTNILKKGNKFKLCDFGISEVASQLKISTMRKGTISYMPPEKLKVKNFLPNDKSDIFSLGVSLYEVIFGTAPYVKKKTANYKEYLVGLETAQLTPIPKLMLKFPTASIRLQNFLSFLQKMIYLNEKKRVGLSELKEFISNTQPFKSMTIPEDEPTEIFKPRQSYEEHFIALHQSKIIFRASSSELNKKIPSEEENLIQFGSNKSSQFKSIQEVQLEKVKTITEQFSDKYQKERLFLTLATSFFSRGVNYLKNSNFQNMNILTMHQSFLEIDTSEIPKIRFYRYLILHYNYFLLRRLKDKYESYLSISQHQLITRDIEHLMNQFRKFLIQFSITNWKEVHEQVKSDEVSLQIGQKFSALFYELFKETDLIKIKQKNYLLGLIFIRYCKEVNQAILSLRSLTSQDQLKETSLSELFDDSIQKANIILSDFSQYEVLKIQGLKDVVQKMMIGEHLYAEELDEGDSNQYEILGLEEDYDIEA